MYTCPRVLVWRSIPRERFGYNHVVGACPILALLAVGKEHYVPREQFDANVYGANPKNKTTKPAAVCTYVVSGCGCFQCIENVDTCNHLACCHFCIDSTCKSLVIGCREPGGEMFLLFRHGDARRTIV